MARRHSSLTRFIRPAPRTKVWVGISLGDDTIPAATVQLLGSLNAAALALRPFTILRTHIDLLYSSDQDAAVERLRGSFARGIFSEQAVTAGIASLPDPASEFDESWFVYQSVSYLSDTLGGDVGQHYAIDSKAMRKVGPNDNVATIFTQAAGVGATLTTSGRYLVQLH